MDEISIRAVAPWPVARSVEYDDELIRYDVDRANLRNVLAIWDHRGRSVIEAFSALAPDNGSLEHERFQEFVSSFGPVLVTGLLDKEAARFRREQVGKGDEDRPDRVGREVRRLRSVIEIVNGLVRQPDEGGHRQLAEEVASHPIAGTTRYDESTGRFVIELRLRSIVDAVYWQLTSHIQKTPARTSADVEGLPSPIYAMPICSVCGGAVLATRLEGSRMNKWHRGCKNTGAQRQRRARAKGEDQ